MLALKLPNSVFLFGQDPASRFQLALEKLGGVFRLVLPYFEVFVDEQIRQLAGDLLSDAGVVRQSS